MLGQFPEQAEDALISLAWLEAAKNRAIDAACAHARVAAGVDVAGPGDDECVAAMRCETCGGLLDWKAWANPDPRGDCVAFLNRYRSRLGCVNVDAVGIGYNFALHLQDLKFPVNRINVAIARDSQRFANRKAEYYWALQERFQNGGIAGVTDELTISQLATVRYKQTPQGRIAIESKEEARKRGVKSPDRAEALMLAYGRSVSAVELVWMDAGNGRVRAPRRCQNPACAKDNGRPASVANAFTLSRGLKFCSMDCAW